MKIPLPKMTTRRWMAAVATLAVVLAGARMAWTVRARWQLADHFGDCALREQGFELRARQLAEGFRQDVERLRQMRDQTLQPPPPVTTNPQTTLSNMFAHRPLSEAEIKARQDAAIAYYEREKADRELLVNRSEQDADRFRRRAAYFAGVCRKYERAMWRPWRPVPPFGAPPE